jgi:DNA-directed RNA polymerase beta subunit
MAKPKDVLATTSSKEYERAINAIAEAGYKDNTIDGLKAYFAFREYKIASQRFHLSAVVNKYKSNVEYTNKLKEWNAELKEQHLKLKEAQVPTEAEKEKDMPWSEILKFCVEAMGNEKYTLEERILLGLYTLLEPVRNDYVNMKLYAEDPKLTEGTYFIINADEKKVVINEYKTSKVYGAIQQHLPDRLAEMITTWFKGETVMFPVTEKAMSRRIISLFKKVTGKPITICALRHSRITFAYKGAPMPKEAKIMAKNMGHSVGTAQSYRFAE